MNIKTYTQNKSLPIKNKSTFSIVKIVDNQWMFVFSDLYEIEISLFNKYFKKDISDPKEEEENWDLKSMIISLLEQAPLNFDLLFEIGMLFYMDKQYDTALYFFNKGFDLVQLFIPQQFTYRKDVLPWNFPANRTFLKIGAMRAEITHKHINPRKAIALYEELLVLNPEDNQGIRLQLATLYLQLNEPKELLKFATQYTDDTEPQIIIGNILALYQTGKLKEAQRQIKEHAISFANVFAELITPSNLSENEFEKLRDDALSIKKRFYYEDDYELDDASETIWNKWEAIEYAEQQAKFWQKTPNALEFLKTNLEKLPK